jgi:hypothetical protein
MMVSATEAHHPPLDAVPIKAAGVNMRLKAGVFSRVPLAHR